MARRFNDAGDRTAAVSVTPFFEPGTLFLNIRPLWNPGDSIDHTFIFLHDASIVNYFQFQKYSTNQVFVGWTTGGVSARIEVADTGLFASGVWGCHIFDFDDAANLQHYYVDNVLKGTSTTAFDVPAATATGFNIGAQGASSANSDICEMGRWNRVLTAAERAVLQITKTPLSVPNGLIRYMPMSGRQGPEPELISETGFNQFGTIDTRQPGPRIFYPTSAYVPSLEAPTIIAPPAVSNTFSIFAPTVSVDAPPATLLPPVVANAFQVFAPLVSVQFGDLNVAPPVISSAFTVYAPRVKVQETTIQEDARELEPHNLRVRIVEFVAGDDLRLSRVYIDLAEGIIISKGYLTIKRDIDNTDAEAIIQKTITTAEQVSGQIIDEDTTGGSIELYFDLSGDETALLTPLIPFAYDVQLVTIGHAIYTCEKGIIIMHQGVTDAIS